LQVKLPAIYFFEIETLFGKILLGGVIMKNSVINLTYQVLKGNTLDVGIKNYGVVYNLSKHYWDEVAVDYAKRESKAESLTKEDYDSCVLFFTLYNLSGWRKKERIIKECFKYLNSNGYIYIWDIDKPMGRLFFRKIKVLLPYNKEVEFTIKEINLFRKNPMNKIINIINKYFTIEEEAANDGIIYIKARKKGNLSDENNTCSTELTIHT